MQKILYIGMDVHQASIVIVVLNAEGKTHSEAIIETKTETVRDFICGLRGELHVTFEEDEKLAPEERQEAGQSSRTPWRDQRVRGKA